MGKKQHQSDKLYLTTTEWKYLYGGHKDSTAAKLHRAKFKRLPFTHCALSLQPFENPLCTTDGVVFDLMSIVPFLKKHGVNPVDGEKLDPKSLIHLKYHKNDAGEFHCPVTYKVFTPTSHIVAIKTSGNVYSYEAVEELNLRAKYFKDLLTDEAFVRSDIIDLQNPNDLDKFNIEKFHHIKVNYKDANTQEAEKKAMEDPKFYLKKMNTETKEILSQLEKDYKPSTSAKSAAPKADAINAAHYSTGKVAVGFTSTVMDVVTQQEADVIDEDTLRYRRVSKKGYVRLITNHGSLNLEICADQTPRAAENFIKHCKNGYYNDTIFHRVIRNFMIQGGDPTGTGTGGESIWEKPFKDEFGFGLSHSGRGVLSMANKGTDTNGSQFFITFRSCKHLDRKHTVFGRVVGGLDVLTVVERLPVNKKTDKPLEDIKIVTAQVFVDPFEEADEQLKKERENLKAKESKAAAEAKPSETAKPKEYRSGVGKYIKPSGDKRKSAAADSEAAKKQKTARTALTDFSAW